MGKKAPIKPAVPARKKATRVAKKPVPAAAKKRTEYFRIYQANRRAGAARAAMCIECTTQPCATQPNPDTGKIEQVSTRCFGCLDRARDSMRAKRALEA